QEEPGGRREKGHAPPAEDHRRSACLEDVEAQRKAEAFSDQLHLAILPAEFADFRPAADRLAQESPPGDSLGVETDPGSPARDEEQGQGRSQERAELEKSPGI